MAFVFSLHKESLKRKFSVYVVLAKSDADTLLYVGKTGDNNMGCNPIISRCGNHFSYASAHSQIRNKITEDHELRDYTYIFEHFNDYPEDPGARRDCIDNINEMERWLNQEIAKLMSEVKNSRLLNPFDGVGYLSRPEKLKRNAFRTADNQIKIEAIVSEVRGLLSLGSI